MSSGSDSFSDGLTFLVCWLRGSSTTTWLGAAAEHMPARGPMMFCANEFDTEEEAETGKYDWRRVIDRGTLR